MDTDIDRECDDEMPSEITHEVNPANQITTLINDPDGPGGLPPVETPLVYDKAGNLVFDGSYVYLYDGLNRLVGVHEGGLLTPLDFNSVGQLLTLPGDLVTSFVYDGLGRLIRVVRPVTPGSADLQIEDAYYDGVRRIQEVVETDPDAAALYIDSPYEYVPTAIREYIYGPDDADEVVCQIDETGEPVFYAQDSQQTVAALVTRSGSAPAVEQALTYEPYGDILIEEHTPEAPPGAIPFNRIGFQGMIFERLDGASVASMPLTADANGNGTFGLYYARNRWYNPRLGRFMTRDPNETAAPVIAALDVNGETSVRAFGAFSVRGQFRDGPNLYAFARLSPSNWRDPLGLASAGVNHLYPKFLGGSDIGPGDFFEHGPHNIYHEFLYQALDESGSRSQSKCLNKWIMMNEMERKLVLTAAAAEAGVDVADSSWTSALDRAYAQANHGVPCTGSRKATQVTIKFLNPNATYTSQMRFAAAKRIAGKLVVAGAIGVTALATAMTFGPVFSGLADPHVRDLAMIGNKYRVQGYLDPIDDVFIFVNLAQVTGSNLAGAAGWAYWEEFTK